MSVFKDDSCRELKRWKDVFKDYKCVKDKKFYVMLPHPITIEMTYNGEKVSFTVNCLVRDKNSGKMYWGEAMTNGTDYPKFKWYDYASAQFDISKLYVVSKLESQKYWGELI